MIDTHCHLTDERLQSQLEDVITRARTAGVSRIISIATDPDDSRAAIALAKGRDDVRCTVGVHPNHSHGMNVHQVEQLRELQKDPTVVAIGETGLDYFHKYAPRDHQMAVFIAQLRVARDVKKPVVIHCREAVDDTLAIMADYEDVPAVFHCFTGTVHEATRILDAGYLIGLTGVVTFKKSDELRDVARLIPDDRLLVETDAPYLAPEPVRKEKVNEPAFVLHTARAIAEARGTTLEQIDLLTTANAQRFFRWD